MLHHISLPVSNLEKSVQFYDSILSTLGYKRVCSGRDYAGYGIDKNKDKFMIKKSTIVKSQNKMFHLAFTAPSQKSVDLFHQVAIDQGGIDNGYPGYRKHYGPLYYAAFIIDLDGHRIEAVINQ